MKTMEIKDFIGKIVIRTDNNQRYKLYEVTSPTIEIIDLKPKSNGVCTVYRYHTINGNPFETGQLKFEEDNLGAQFKTAYDAYCRTKDAYWEEYGYWLRRE